jgi:hypothetical protein
MDGNERIEFGTGTLLPHTLLRRASDDTQVDVRKTRGPRVLLLMHSHSCAECLDYLRALLAREADWADWGARVSGIVPGTSAPALVRRDTSVTDSLLIDEARKLADGSARVIAADEWGEIHCSVEVGTEHTFPTIQDMVEWARFIAIQCPECEGPEGEWRGPL